MTPIEARQLGNDLSNSFTTTSSLTALSVAVMYQQIGQALGLGNDWAANSLLSLAATVSREAPRMRRPQFAQAYAQTLERLAAQLGETSGPVGLTLIDGGKQDDDGPVAA